MASVQIGRMGSEAHKQGRQTQAELSKKMLNRDLLHKFQLSQVFPEQSLDCTNVTWLACRLAEWV